MSKLLVDEIGGNAGAPTTIASGKNITGTASQFQMTDVVQGDVLYGSAADTLSRLAPGTAGQVLQTAGAGANPVWAADAGGLFSGYAIFCDQKTLGTDGGTFTSGAWRVRDLNTTIANTDASNIALGTNEFTLQTGNYYIQWQAVAGAPNMSAHQSGLHDASSFIQMGKSMRNWTGTGDSCGFARVTPASATTYTIQHQCQTTTATTGFGWAADFAVEIYTVVEIIKES